MNCPQNSQSPVGFPEWKVEMDNFNQVPFPLISVSMKSLAKFHEKQRILWPFGEAFHSSSLKRKQPQEEKKKHFRIEQLHRPGRKKIRGLKKKKKKNYIKSHALFPEPKA